MENWPLTCRTKTMQPDISLVTHDNPALAVQLWRRRQLWNLEFVVSLACPP